MSSLFFSSFADSTARCDYEESNIIEFTKPYVEQKTILNNEELMDLLPHRYPMLLLDRLENIEIGKSAVGIKNVSANDHFFPGHFPGHPVMPGVLIVESMAQAAAALVMHTLGFRHEDVNVYFMSIDNARFRQIVKPGDTLHLHVEHKHHRGFVWKFQGYAKVQGKVVAEACYTAAIKKKEQSS